MQRLRCNIRELLQYLNREELFVSLNHVASRINGDVTAAAHRADHAVVDGSKSATVAPAGAEPDRAGPVGGVPKVPVAGSESHSGAASADFVDAPHARTREEFLRSSPPDGLRSTGGEGHYFTMASDIIRIAVWVLPGAPAAISAVTPGNWRYARDCRRRRSLDCRCWAVAAGGSRPRTSCSKTGSTDRSFFDLVARPAGTGSDAMNVAIFTDNDFAKVNGVTTSLRAASHAPPGIHPRIYTASDLAVDRDDYFACGVRRPHAVLRRHADVPAVLPGAAAAGPRGSRRSAALHHAGTGRTGGAVRRLAYRAADGGQLSHRLAAYTER